MIHRGNVDLEVLAVSSIIFNEEVGDYLQALEPRWLSHEPAKRAWSHAVTWYQDHRDTIPREVVRERVPQFKFKAGNGSVDGILDSLQDRFLTMKVQEIYEEEVTCMEDPSSALSLVISRCTALQASIQRDTGSDISETIDDAVARYRHREDNQGALGLPWPWEPLQRATNGAQAGQYTVIYARPKQQKTFILLNVLKHWIKYSRKKVLLITREMMKDQIQDRFLCLWAGVSYKRFRSGGLSADEKRKITVAAAEIKEFKRVGRFIVESVDSYGAEAAAEVFSLCEKYGLEDDDVLGVDGMDWFAENSDWKSLRAFSQGLKKAATGGEISGEKKVALNLIVTGQGNQDFKEDQNSDAGKEMSGGDGMIRDCDLALKIAFNEPDHEIRIAIAVVREGEGCQFTINAIPCSDFSLKYSDEPDEDRETSIIPAPTIRTRAQVGKQKRKGRKGATRSEKTQSSRGKKGRKGPRGA